MSSQSGQSKQSIEYQYDRLEKVEMSEANRFIVRKYLDRLKLRGVKDTTLRNNIEAILFITKNYPYDFTTATEHSIAEFKDKLDSHVYITKRRDGSTRRLAEATKQQYRLVLKILLRLAGCDEVAQQIQTKNISSSKMPEDILTDADIDLMLNATRNLRDAALIAALYETGCRRGELLSCAIKNLTFTVNGARLQVTGKTGARVVPLVFSVPYLRRWLEIHPLRNDMNAPLWTLSRAVLVNNESARDAAMTPAAMTAILKSVAHNAGITKRINPHSFRHARATRLAGAFSEQQMKRFLGWTSASAMPAVYVHLSGRDIEDATLAMYGVTASKQPTAIQVRKCPECGGIVSQSAKYCDVCGAQL